MNTGGLEAFLNFPVDLRVALLQVSQLPFPRQHELSRFQEISPRRSDSCVLVYEVLGAALMEVVPLWEQMCCVIPLF